MTRYFVIWQYKYQDEIKDVLYQDICKGVVRQGWGISGTDLRQNMDQWVLKYIARGKDVWGEDISVDKARDRYGILKPMTEISPGDVVLVPNQPDREHFVIARATVGEGGACYDFDDRDADKRGVLGDDFRHMVYVNVDTLKEISYLTSLDTLFLKKVANRALRKAVNNVRDQQIREVMDKMLEGEPAQPESRTVLGIMEEHARSLLPQVQAQLQKLPPHALEEVVEGLFSRSGLMVERRHQFDGRGRDMDLILSHTCELPEVLQDLGVDSTFRLNIQIANRTGIDRDDAGKLDQLPQQLLEQNTYSVLISTADDFTEECKKKAEERGIILVNGTQLAGMLVKSLLAAGGGQRER